MIRAFNIVYLLILLSALSALSACKLADSKVRGSIGPDKLCFPEDFNDEPYASGSGSEADPYVICSAKQLNFIGSRSQDWDNYFIQGADLDLNAYDVNTFNMIGVDDNSAFSGVYDGNSFSIKNLSLTLTSATTGLGLFLYVKNGTLINIDLENFNLQSDGDNVGALVATLENGTVVKSGLKSGAINGNAKVGGLIGEALGVSTSISLAYAIADVNSQGNYVGGLIGLGADVNIAKSYTKGTVVSSGEFVGGFVGELNNLGHIEQSFSESKVTSSSKQVGGFVGRFLLTINFPVIKDCYSTGDVSGGPMYVGGFVGNNAGDIRNSFSTGNVTGTDIVGGFSGQNIFVRDFDSNFSSGTVSATSNHGGLVGYMNTIYPPTNSYFTKGFDNSVGSYIENNLPAAIEHATASWDKTDVWSYRGNTLVPQLKWYIDEKCNDENKIKSPYAGGSGEKHDPYIICTSDHLKNLAQTSSDWDKHFLQGADINLSDYDGSTPEKSFPQIGTYISAASNPFTGEYNGDGYKIINYTFASSTFDSTHSAGLFGVVDTTSGAVLRNIIMENVNVNAPGYSFVGGLAAIFGAPSNNNSYIENCHVTSGQVIGGNYVGGLIGSVGVFSGRIEITGSSTNVSVTSTQSGDASVGGLIGSLRYANVNRSYAKGDVTSISGNLVGGLAGDFFVGEIAYSYSTGRVEGNDRVGGLVGRSSSNNIIYSYATGDVLGNDYIGGLEGDIFGSNIQYSYSLGAISAVASNYGGLVGFQTATVSPTSSWFTGYDNSIGDYDSSATTVRTNAAGAWDFTNNWYDVFASSKDPTLLWEADSP